MTDVDHTVVSKQCTKCGETKPVDCFYRHKKARDGFEGRCKQCKATEDKRRHDKKANLAYRARMLERDRLLLEGKCRCYTCSAVKVAEEFDPCSRATTGLSYECRDCRRIRDQAYRAANREQRAAKQREYYAKNREKICIRQRETRCPVDAKRRNAEYRKKHGPRLREANKQWRRDNRERVRERSREYLRERYARDPIYAMRERVKSLIQLKIRSAGYTKRSRTHEILGCDWDFFKAHIERQFLKGMSWDNRSEWHIDHIIPISSAKTEEDVIRLNHFTNLRPMWAKDNIAKGDQITHLI